MLIHGSQFSHSQWKCFKHRSQSFTCRLSNTCCHPIIRCKHLTPEKIKQIFNPSNIYILATYFKVEKQLYVLWTSLLNKCRPWKESGVFIYPLEFTSLIHLIFPSINHRSRSDISHLLVTVPVTRILISFHAF